MKMSRFDYLRWIPVHYLLLIQILMVSPSKADEFTTASHATSKIAENAKFEIVGSQLTVRDTFRLDRICGKVDQLVETKSGGLTWETMPVEKIPSCNFDGKAHFELYLSSITTKNSFLMNTDTGTTWMLQKFKSDDGNEILGWLLF